MRDGLVDHTEPLRFGAHHSVAFEELDVQDKGPRPQRGEPELQGLVDVARQREPELLTVRLLVLVVQHPSIQCQVSWPTGPEAVHNHRELDRVVGQKPVGGTRRGNS